MAETSMYRPRLSVEVTEEQKAELTRHLGAIHGLQRAIFSAIIDDLIEVCNGPNKEQFLSGIINRQISIIDFIKLEK